MVYFKGENESGHRSFLSVKHLEDYAEIEIHIEDISEIPLSVFLDIETAIKFKKALTNEIQIAIQERNKKGGQNG